MIAPDLVATNGKADAAPLASSPAPSVPVVASPTGAEAPASVTVKVAWPAASGASWDVMLTLRDATGGDVLRRLDAALAWLEGRGALPAGSGAGAGQADEGDPDAPVCPVHGVRMKRYSNDRGAWYSHKTPDGGWCKGGAS